MTSLSHNISVVAVAVFSAVVWCLLLSVPQPATAQFFGDAVTGLSPESQSELSLDPAYPEPNRAVEVLLDAYNIDTVGARIFWFIDGVERVEDRNERVITVVPGRTPVRVEAQVRSDDFATFSVTKIISPVYLDIIIEPSVTTPVWYVGKKLPSEGVATRAHAIFSRPGQAAGSDLTYQWFMNNQSLYAGPIRGRETAEFEMPLAANVLLTVQVTDDTGAILARKTIKVDAVDPELYFYENNPLLGLSRSQIGNSFNLVANEITVRAEPYFMDTAIRQRNLFEEWVLNGATIDNPSTDQRNITLRGNTDSRGTAVVSYAIRNLSSLLQGVEEQFSVTFDI